jgi:hypothetical protein
VAANEEELWYIQQQVYLEDDDQWEDEGYPGIPGADLKATQATALSLHLEQNPSADSTKARWVQDGPDLWLLYCDDEDTGFFLTHSMMWVGTTPHPEP